MWFAYSPDRKGAHPQGHLADFQGVLQAYAWLQRRVRKWARAGAACWAHARRKFYELHAARPISLMTEALHRIGELYAVEEDFRGKPPDERPAARQLHATPLLDELERWLHATLVTLSRKSDTAAAILYALKLWPALTRYVDDGHIEIDSSVAERRLPGIVLDRRNFMYSGVDSGGERAAAMYGLVRTARLNGIEEQLRLRRNYKAIYQDLVDQYDFTGSYNSVKRFRPNCPT